MIMSYFVNMNTHGYRCEDLDPSNFNNFPPSLTPRKQDFGTYPKCWKLYIGDMISVKHTDTLYHF